MTVILYAIPAFFLLIGLELWADRRARRGHYRLNDALTSLSAGVLSRLMTIVHQLLPFTLYVVVFDALAQFQLSQAWYIWVVAFVVYDFLYYWNHRLGHEVSVLWAAHVVHHSSEDYNLTTALRQTSGSLLSWVFYLPMAVLGFPPEMVITVAALNLVYQFWVHTQYIDKLGWLEAVLVTPSNHRVHHAQNRVYIDRNYGGVLIVWDRLFDTYMPELRNVPPVYGIRGALKSFNPLWANLQVYAQLWHDSYHTAHWRDKWRVWFGRTGWRPKDMLARFPAQKQPLSDFRKYDPALGARVSRYCLVQHAVMLAMTVYLLLSLNTLTQLATAVIMVSVFVTCMQIGWVLQRSKAAVAMEGPRLLAIPLLWLASGLPGVAVIALLVGHALSLVWLLTVIRSEEDKLSHDDEPQKVRIRK